MILRGLKIIAKQLVYLSIILVVVVTLLVASVYWLSNAVEQRQDEIASWVGDKIGHPVHIGTASLDWLGLEPKLQIGDVAVLSDDSQKEIAMLGNLYLGLDLIASVKRGKPVLNDITLSGLKLAVTRDHSGQIQLQDFILPADSATQEFDWKSWVTLLNRFHFEKIKVDYIDQLNTALSGQYELIEGTIIHQDMQWETNGSLMPPSSLGDAIEFTAKAKLDDDGSFQLDEWEGHAKIVDLQIALLAKGHDWQDIIISKGAVTADLSITGVNAKIDAVTADLKLFKANLASTSTESSDVSLDSVRGNIYWEQTDDRWRLSGQTILSINGESWPETKFSADKDPQGDVHVLTEYLRLSDLTSLALLSSKTPESIQQQGPAGDVEALDFHYSFEKGLTELTFKLKEGIILPWQDLPGVTNLSAQLSWQNGRGNIHLNSHNLTLDAKSWLDEALFFDAIVGVLQLEYDQDSWQLYSQGLKVWNEDLTVHLDGEINNSDGKIITDLKIGLEDITVNQWKKYVPRKDFHIDFKTWSDDAFVAGKVTTGEILLKGELSAFPYEKEPEKGQFNMALQAENVQLHYAPGWPDLTGLTGTITGSGNDLVIKTKLGKTAGFDFLDVTTVITKLTESEPILRVEGEVTGTTAKALQFLKDSPLKERFGVIADSAIAKGKSNINLDLIVPLADVDNTTVAGYVSFKNSQLHYKSSPEIGMTGVNGRLYFSEKGVKAKNITATAFNESIDINVKPDGDKAIISVLSHIATEQINKVWPGEVPKYIAGRTAYKLDLTVVERELGQFYLDFDVTSNLKGLTLDMPTPFGKVATQTIPFNATMKNSGNALIYTANFGDVLNIIAKPNKTLWQGEVRFGQGKAMLPKNGIKLSGQLDSLSIDDWLSWSNQQKTSGSTLANSIDDVSLTLGRLTGFEQTLTNLNLASQKDAQGWRTNIHSDQAKGFIYLPNDLTGSARVEIDLEHLAIRLPETDKTQTKQAGTRALWPSIDLSITSLLIDDKTLGKLNLTAQRNKTNWVINKAQLSSDAFEINVLEGVWEKAGTGDASKFQLHLESDDLGLLLADFGYQQAIDAEVVILKTNVSWPNTPLDFEMKTLSGSLNMDIGKGILQDVEPGAAGRIFGLMSITTLPRRLSLDFNDLFGKGFTFDSISGDFKFHNGLAITDDFLLKSASAEIEISGAVDLVEQQYNQQVKITPNVSSTLPVAGAVAGGPVGLGVGTAILLVDKLADKLFDKNIVNLISYKYDLTGPWDDPQLNVAKTDRSNAVNTPRKVIGN